MTPAATLTGAGFARGSLIALQVLAGIGFCAWWGLILTRRGRPLVWRRFTLELPTPWLGLRQGLIAVIDLLIAGAVLYLILDSQAALPFGSFIVAYILAQVLGLISQVPGGIGIFESSFLLLTSGQIPPSQLLAALIVYRIVYYFLPLTLAALVLLAYEVRQSRILQSRMVRSTLLTIDALIPQVFSLLLLLRWRIAADLWGHAGRSRAPALAEILRAAAVDGVLAFGRQHRRARAAAARQRRAAPARFGLLRNAGCARHRHRRLARQGL